MSLIKCLKKKTSSQERFDSNKLIMVNILIKKNKPNCYFFENNILIEKKTLKWHIS